MVSQCVTKRVQLRAAGVRRRKNILQCFVAFYSDCRYKGWYLFGCGDVICDEVLFDSCFVRLEIFDLKVEFSNMSYRIGILFLFIRKM